ncbi:MAG: DUF86 domain-containing protein [Proteobacteria bacterium]|nr:DUF86 domain-containing protein [Pseudomonadota bacterium]
MCLVQKLPAGHSSRGQKSFSTDELVVARVLTPSFRKKHSEIPWKKIVGMRNIIVHDYFQIDQKIV